ncbi:ABC transporter permease [Piscinibacter sp. HJYY11]|uniref:ABC transporter permease n=1 Tax=Piscinibacter sp. HJYY11 TaxID=2801333 RepID=UPI00191DFFE7|nr:ABC transporter permease [Piscinibacter sp. HJYY11]MBL0730709.1 ABC transporter permease [Piscinibacter sp. HJYY11]
MLPALIKKELLALIRDPHSLAALFLLPVLFIVIMSLALKDYYSPPQKSLAYAVQAEDTGPLARALVKNWERGHGPAQPLSPDWQQQLREGRLKYVLVLQPGLSQELEEPSLPTQAHIRLVAEPGLDGNLLNTLRAELAGTAGELKARAALAQNNAPKPAADASMINIVQPERAGNTGPRPSAVQQNVPAWLVFGMFFVVASLAGLVVEERTSGTLARLRSLGVSRSTLLASKGLPYLGVNAVQAGLMLAVGVWLMPAIGGDALSLTHVNWPALLLALVAISLAAVSMAIAIACAVRTHAQAAAVGPIINVLMAAIGGIMVPKFVMPASMQRLAEWSPMNWGLEALLNVVLRGGDVASTAPQLARLSLFAALMFGIALALFQRSFQRSSR